ncbi:MAG: hypothetical protein AAFM92_02140 [Pseudomonadota bacterium]
MRFVFGLICAAFMAVGGASTPSSAQQAPTGSGFATKLDILGLARSQNLQAPYPRALYAWIQANPQRFQDPNFYVNFIAYLLSTADGIRCDRAFANEFERNDFFNGVFQYQQALAGIISSARLSQRYDRHFGIDTGQYVFETQTLPIQRVRGLDAGLGSNISATNGRTTPSNCARQIFQGTPVDAEAFPWRFTVVDENIRPNAPSFPFPDKLQLPASDARTIFETFGRDLFAIVSYQFVAANNGEYKIQAFPTDATLFGLSASSVVRILEFRHPQVGGAPRLDITTPMKLRASSISLAATINFEQQDFRAVGTGTRTQAATGFAPVSSVPLSGTAAVGHSSFILRLELPGYNAELPGLLPYWGDETPTTRYATVFGKVDLGVEGVGQQRFRGTLKILENVPQRGWTTSPAVPFRGSFEPEPVASNEPAAPAAPAAPLVEDAAPAPAAAGQDG